MNRTLKIIILTFISVSSIFSCSCFSPPQEVENIVKTFNNIWSNDPDIESLKARWYSKNDKLLLDYKLVNYNTSKKFICFALIVKPLIEHRSSTRKIIDSLLIAKSEIELIPLARASEKKMREKTYWNVFVENTVKGCEDDYSDYGY